MIMKNYKPKAFQD